MKHILLAEDESAHIGLFQRAVEQSGIPCHVDVVHDGVETIDYLFAIGEYRYRDSEQIPDLIVLDLKMPKLDGLQVLQVLRRVRDGRMQFPPVIVLTSSEEDGDVCEAYRLGAQSYICKPTSYREFAGAVRETLEYWLGLNRPLPKRRAGAHFIHR